MEFLYILELVLRAVACCNIFSGIPGSLKMWRTGKTAGWPVMFFVIGFCGSVGMFTYGYMMNNSTIFMLNGLQTVVFIYYILSYVILADTKGSSMAYLSMAMVYLATLYTVFTSFDDTQTDERLNLLGSASGAIFLLMNCSTVLDVIAAVQAKSAVFDLPMLIFGMLNNVLFFSYGLLLQDLYLYVPPLPFILTGLMKFMLMSIYTTKEKKKAE